MDWQIWFEIVLIASLILANGIFSLSEIALLSARKPRLQQRAEDGDARAERALEMVESPNRLLSTVQVGITLVGILSGAVGGATLGDTLTAELAKVAVLAPYSKGIALAIIVLVITYFSLVLGELVPKRLALANPERLALKYVGLLGFLSTITAPVVRLLSASTDLVLKLFRISTPQEPAVTDDDVSSLMEQGAQVGVFEEAEQVMIKGVFRLSDRRVDDLMTPRTEIEWLDLDEPFQANLEIVVSSQHNYFPVANGSLDNVLGILSAKDLLVKTQNCTEVNLNELLVAPLFVPESMPAFDLLDKIKISPGNLALVIDEFGGLLGMVTLYDMLKTIVGDIPVQGEAQEPQLVVREDGSLLVDGLMPIDEMKEHLHIDDLPDEERVGDQTLGGMVMSVLGAIPSAGQHFEWQGLRFEVMDMDGRRVDKVLVSKIDDTDQAVS
jgi:putative hemolysin